MSARRPEDETDVPPPTDEEDVKNLEDPEPDPAEDEPEDEPKPRRDY